MSPYKALTRRRDLLKAQSVEECHNDERGGSIQCKKIRLAFANVAGIPLEPNSKRDDEIQKWIRGSNADIIGMAETNLCWHKARGGPFQERMRRSTGTSVPQLTTNLHASIAYNEVEEWPNEYQIGGTALITRGGMACRIMNKGKDGEKLGRWCWTDYRGLRGI